ncbi:MAG: chemotaxis protein CheW [Leptonema sp. (in: bacteria)]
MQEMKNKYLVFQLENDSFGISLSAVNEVISFMPITPLYEVSNYLVGVINLRGKIIPILDLRLKFHLPKKEYTERTIFIIVNIEYQGYSSLLGLAVDMVKDVITIEDKDLQQPPEVGFKFKSKYLLGIVQFQEEIITILDINQILTTEEIIEIQENS